MGLDHIRAEIALRRLVGRQRKDLLQLEKSGIATVPSKALLQRLLDKIALACSERNRHASVDRPW